MPFDLTDLRLFLHVLEAGSITHGATRAHLALPSASARLRGMEDTLGLSLLVRNHRGVEPTAAGNALAQHARIVLDQLARMRADLDDYAAGLKGEVRLLTNTAAMTEFLPDALASYLAHHARVTVDVEEYSSVEIAKAVAGGFADVGIMLTAVDHGALRLFPFAIDRLALVVPGDSPLARRPTIAFQEIAAQPRIGLSVGNPLQEYLDDHARRAGHSATLRARLRTFDGVCRMVAEHAGIAIMPVTAAARCAASMAIAAISLTDAWATRHLAVCVRDVTSLPRHASALFQHLAAHGADSAGN